MARKPPQFADHWVSLTEALACPTWTMASASQAQQDTHPCLNPCTGVLFTVSQTTALMLLRAPLPKNTWGPGSPWSRTSEVFAVPCDVLITVTLSSGASFQPAPIPSLSFRPTLGFQPFIYTFNGTAFPVCLWLCLQQRPQHSIPNALCMLAHYHTHKQHC